MLCDQCSRLEADLENYERTLALITIQLSDASQAEDAGGYTRLRADWHAARLGLENTRIVMARHRRDHGVP
jgi:hypothetical protein